MRLPPAADEPLLEELQRLQIHLGAEAAGVAGERQDRRNRLLALRDDLVRLLARLQRNRDRIGGELAEVQRGVEAVGAYARMAGLTRKLMR